MSYSIDPTMQVAPADAAERIGWLLGMMTNETGTEDPASSLRSNTSTSETDATTTQSPDADIIGDTEFANPTVTDYPINSPFGPRGSGFHGGVDIGTPVGTTLVAAVSGTVTHAGNDDPGGYGNWVEVSGPGGISVRYGHMSQIGVKAGQTVKAGQPIGKSGGQAGAEGAGNSEGPHVHFEVRKGGTSIDPSSFLAGATPAQMKPVMNEADAGAAAAVPPDANAGLAGQAQNLKDVATKDVIQSGGMRATYEAGAAPPQALGSEVAPDAAGMDSYYNAVLNMIGAPSTPANLAFMKAWQKAEGGDATNPFNTTQDAPGATNFNSVGVKRYPNAVVGASATAKTLLNGRYANIIRALKLGADPMAAAQALAASPWGTGALVMQILGG